MHRRVLLPGISAVLIAKDEEKLIGRCLRSLRHVDQVVVHDTGSSDRTAAIAEEAGALVVRSAPASPFHFGEARQRALAKARHAWTLSIDADEVLREGPLRELRRAVAADHPSIAGYEVGFHMRVNAKDPGFRMYLLRFFRTSRLAWRYRVHEQPVLIDPDDRIGRLEKPTVLEHLPSTDRTSRAGQNFELLRLAVAESPEYTRLFRYLADELMTRTRWDEAVPHWERYIAETQEPEIERAHAILELGRCHRSAGRISVALKCFEEAWEACPSRREPLYARAEIFMERRLWDDAIRDLGRVLAVPASSKPDFHLNWGSVWGTIPSKALAYCESQRAQAAKEATHDAGSDHQVPGAGSGAAAVPPPAGPAPLGA